MPVEESDRLALRRAKAQPRDRRLRAGGAGEVLGFQTGPREAKHAVGRFRQGTGAASQPGAGSHLDGHGPDVARSWPQLLGPHRGTQFPGRSGWCTLQPPGIAVIDEPPTGGRLLTRGTLSAVAANRDVRRAETGGAAVAPRSASAVDPPSPVHAATELTQRSRAVASRARRGRPDGRYAIELSEVDHVPGDAVDGFLDTPTPSVGCAEDRSRDLVRRQIPRLGEVEDRQGLGDVGAERGGSEDLSCARRRR